MQSPYISVVIPTYNRSKLLVKTIPALVNQQTDGFTYEVIFVSDGSSDNSYAILKEAVAHHPDILRYHYIDHTGGPSAPRNVGIRAAKGEVIIILDDDVLPEPDLVLWYAEFHKAHPQQHYAALGELYVPLELLDDPMSLFRSFPYDYLRKLDCLSFMHFWTCNVSVKREFMLDAGMFDENFLYYEDLICGYRLAENGMHLHFLPSACGQHLHQLKPSGIPVKGLFTGRWLYPFIECVPDTIVKEKFGILSTDVGACILVKRVLRRLALHMVANPLSMACLRMLGATGNKRDRITDLYYYALFRRNVLAGYHQAKREARDAHRIAVSEADPKWVDRGE
jgi:glycosyltransferase involved in cell wall biosynthesis